MSVGVTGEYERREEKKKKKKKANNRRRCINTRVRVTLRRYTLAHTPQPPLIIR